MISINKDQGFIDIDSPFAKSVHLWGKVFIGIGLAFLLASVLEPVLSPAMWVMIFIAVVIFLIPGFLMLRYRLHILIEKDRLVEHKVRLYKESITEIRFDDVNKICLMFRIATATSAGNQTTFMVYPVLVLNRQGIARYGDNYYSLSGNLGLDEFSSRREFFDAMDDLSEITGLQITASKLCPAEVLERFERDDWR
ncbi:hypothetical protein [Thalassolituus alkanivorans]|uniref:hypothetical protein n=1 Tax=Thalassolituus alkanivorans TaxID=2881055 RepID=UPI001E5B65C3|nr:hypothetical protein [Thalassolituus alkanivorans]MCB2385608.1 hypothetical protein [Thalassolituus alkanivorans]MCB2421542.1 hypothetical protein [Thalassolituus alkanivorans]